MKYFIFADIHGFYNLFEKQLKEVGFDKDNPEHIFVSLGDLLDRGNYPRECLRFVNSLPKNRKILIRGNHEDLIEEAIKRKYFLSHDYHNGTVGTCISLAPNSTSEADLFQSLKEDKDLQTYLNSLVDYYEDDRNIFVHGWIPCKYKRETKQYFYNKKWRQGDWASARWINGMEAWKQGVRVTVDNDTADKTIYCGHWHTSWGHHFLHNYGEEFLSQTKTYLLDSLEATHPFACFDPFIDTGIVALDGCTAFSGKVNCAVVDR